MIALNVPTALSAAITGSSTTVTNTLKPNVRYQVQADTLCYIAQGATAQTAQINGAAGSQIISPHVPVFISGNNGAFLTVIGTTGRIFVTAGEE